MSKNSKVNLSVVVLNYNYGRFLKQSIDSLLTQTVLPDEIIVVDDHSTDESLLIMHNYVQCDRVHIIRNRSNLGTAASINEGIKNVSFEWVFCLSADDYLEKNLVEELKTTIALDEVDIIYYDLFVVGPYAGDFAKKVPLLYSSEHERYLWKFPNPSSEVIANLSQSNFIHGSSAFRKSLWQQLGGFREMQGVHEDHDFFVRAVNNGAQLCRIAQPMLNYRRHSKEQRNNTKNLEASLATLREQLVQRDFEIATLREIQVALQDVAWNILENKPTAPQTLSVGDAKPSHHDRHFIESLAMAIAHMPEADEELTGQSLTNALIARARVALMHSDGLPLTIALLTLAALTRGTDAQCLALIRALAGKCHLEPITHYFQPDSEHSTRPPEPTVSE